MISTTWPRVEMTWLPKAILVIMNVKWQCVADYRTTLTRLLEQYPQKTVIRRAVCRARVQPPTMEGCMPPPNAIAYWTCRVLFVIRYTVDSEMRQFPNNHTCRGLAYKTAE